MAVTIETAGLDRLFAALPGLLDNSAEAGADSTVRIARSTVTVGPDAPHTRDTIEAVKTGQGECEVQAEEAAVVLELGTRHMPARPFLLPAATDDATVEAMVAAIKAGLK